MIELFGGALVFAFVICCVASAILQIIAWSRHARKGVPVSLQALWRPEGHFDEVGLRRIQLARRLLMAGGFAYLTYGVLLLASTAASGIG